MKLPPVDFLFYYGQCTLTIRSASDEIRIKNHWINDMFTDLVEAVDLLLSGTESVSCRWPGPYNEGHFIDLVADPDGGVNVAVHAFPFPEGNSYAEIWAARRGPCLFDARLDHGEFIRSFATALRRVRVLDVDASGMIRDYPLAFPQAAFDRIERRAHALGYKPTPTHEVVNPPPADD